MEGNMTASGRTPDCTSGGRQSLPNHHRTMEAIIAGLRAIRKERIQRGLWVECLNLARAFRLANEPPIGHIYGFMELLIREEIKLIDVNRRRRRREVRLNQRWQEGEPMEIDEWDEEESASSGVGDTASTTDESVADGGVIEEDDDADVVVEGEMDGADAGVAPDYPEAEGSGSQANVSDVEVIVEQDEWDSEEERSYEPLTPPPEDMWALDN